MQYGRAPSFDRTFRKLAPTVRSLTEDAITRFIHGLDSGQLRQITFVMVGTHDEIRRYLKSI